MHTYPRRRATYANIVSTLALVIGVTGGGAAVAANLAADSVSSRHIQDGSVRSVDLKDGAVLGADIDEDSLSIVPRADLAELAKNAEQATSAGAAETARRLLGVTRASVNADGSLNEGRSFGVVSAEQTTTPGRYVVTFDGPRAGCFLMPTVAHNSPERIVGYASAWLTPSPDPDLPNLSQVTVETHGPGTADTIPDPAPFSLVVWCGGQP
jgi:hypothetical protein